MSPAPTSQVVLVAGAAGGIGQAVVSDLVAQGATVVGLDLRAPPAGGAPCELVTCDLSQHEACHAAVQGVVERHGRLDAMVHVAGITRDKVSWKLPPEDWNLVLAVNLSSAFYLARAAIPPMRAQQGGAIVLVSSINGERGKFGQTAYAASKAGLFGLAKSLAREVGAFGIRVNVISPGLIETQMTADLPPEVRAQALDETCLARLGTPEDVGGVVSFLLSPAARHITGQTLRVDGGQYL